MIGINMSLSGGICFAAEGAAGTTKAGARPPGGLTLRQRAIIPIAALTATGDMSRLEPSLAAGLDAGLTVNEIKEILVQLFAYAGFPRSLNGLNAFLDVLDARVAKGVADETGREASPYPADKTRHELGSEIQTVLAGAPVKGRLFDFAPAIDRFLKEHLFGDIFGRDALTPRDREIATVAALAGMSGVGAQLRAHFAIALNAGLTEEQLHEVNAVLETSVGTIEAKRAAAELAEAIAQRTP